MTKIVLGKRPESFKRKVTFPMLEGGDGTINCEFRYRTRTEFGKFIDSMVADAEAADQGDAKKAVDAGAVKLADIMNKTVSKNADYLMDVLMSWDIEGFDLTRETAAQLADELPAAAVAIMEAYQAACVEGRWGN